MNDRGNKYILKKDKFMKRRRFMSKGDIGRPIGNRELIMVILNKSSFELFM